MSSYVTIIRLDKRKTYLAVASREGCVINHEPLNARWPDYEAARREAKRKHPRTRVIVPDLGERPPAERNTNAKRHS